MWRTLFGDRKAETFPPLAEEDLTSLQRGGRDGHLNMSCR